MTKGRAVPPLSGRPLNSHCVVLAASGLHAAALYLAALGEGGVPYQLTEETEAPAAWGGHGGPSRGPRGKRACLLPASPCHVNAVIRET